MSLNFEDSVHEYINLGDITAARFLLAEAWSVLSFFRIENSASDSRSIISKSVGGDKQFFLAIDAQSAPSNIDVFTPSFTLVIAGGDNIALNTWYLVCVTSDASGNMKEYLVGMDGTFLDDGVTGTQTADVSDLTGDIRVATRGNTGAVDEMDGDIDYVCYVQKVISKNEILGYLYDPVRSALRFKANDTVPFFLKLGPGEATSLDWSGSGNSGTIVGAGVTANQAPPVKLHTIQSVIPLIEVAAGGADVRKEVISAYMAVNA